MLDTVTSYRDGDANVRRDARTSAVWYARLEVESVLKERASEFKASIGQTDRATTREGQDARQHVGVLEADQTPGNRSAEIVDRSPLIVPLRVLVAGNEYEALFDDLRGLLRSFRQSLDHDRRVLLEQFELTDFARKVVGVGSVGTRAWIALLFGRDGCGSAVPADERGRGIGARGARRQERVQKSWGAGRRRSAADAGVERHLPRLGPRPAGLDGVARDFYGRQLKDWKGSAEIEQMVPAGMAAYGKLCGWTLARAHARSGDRIAIAAYLGGGNAFDRAILEFSKAYADQNDRDYQALVDAVRTGRIKAETGSDLAVALRRRRGREAVDGRDHCLHLTGNLSDRRGTRRAGQLLGRGRERVDRALHRARLVGEVALGVGYRALGVRLYLRHGRRESVVPFFTMLVSGSALTELLRLATDEQ